MRRAILILATLSALVFVMAQPAAAAPPIRESGTFTYAFGTTSECEQQGGRTVCTDTTISIQEGPDFSVVCVDQFTYSISPSGRYQMISQQSGCTELAPGAFTVSGDLSTATLSPTTVQLYSCDGRRCTEGDVVTVSATFTGTGELNRYSGRGSFKDGDCTYRYTFEGQSREGTFEITIDGSTSTGPGSVGEEEYTFTVRCR